MAPNYKYVGCLLIINRKKLMIFGQLLIAIDMIIIGFAAIYMPDNAVLIAILIIIYFFVFPFALSASLWAYLGETQNEKGMTISTTCNYLTNTTATLIFPNAVNGVGLPAILFFFAFCMTATAVYCIIDISETKNKTREEIELHIFPPQTNIEAEID